MLLLLSFDNQNEDHDGIELIIHTLTVKFSVLLTVIRGSGRIVRVSNIWSPFT